MTAKEKILRYLANKKFTYYGQELPANWCPSGALHNWSVGGSSAARRIREMRADGIEINCSILKYDRNLNKLPKAVWCYALITRPSEIDFKKGKLKGK